MGRRTRDRRPPQKSGLRRADRRAYEAALQTALEGNYADARDRLESLLQRSSIAPLWQARVSSDLAALHAVNNDLQVARDGWQRALAYDAACDEAQRNLAMLDRMEQTAEPAHGAAEAPVRDVATADRPNCKVAILSFLFSWPSTAGGIIHTVELAQFLAKAGYEVRHFFARHRPWNIGSVEGSLPSPSQPIEFSEAEWQAETIQQRFRSVVDQFAPDYVIITDAWNFKPLLAEAMRGYRYYLRQQSQECLCPLNNLRLLIDGDGSAVQCPRHQLATPDACLACLDQRAQFSGGLHQAERALSGVGTARYTELLRAAYREAEAVLVLNPMIEAVTAPYAGQVKVVTWGMDPARFPWPWPEANRAPPEKKAIFMAGVVEEPIKGFRVLHEACARLRQQRHDFELIATGAAARQVDEFTRFIGWLSQEELPRQLHDSYLLAMPTIAQEGLGRSTVEAMAVGRPVVASRIGGLPYTVADGTTGLLCRPGDAADLADKLNRLLDDTALARQMGLAGRRRFEEEFTWEVVIERDYRPLLQPRSAKVSSES